MEYTRDKVSLQKKITEDEVPIRMSLLNMHRKPGGEGAHFKKCLANHDIGVLLVWDV